MHKVPTKRKRLFFNIIGISLFLIGGDNSKKYISVNNGENAMYSTLYRRNEEMIKLNIGDQINPISVLIDIIGKGRKYGAHFPDIYNKLFSSL